MSAAGPLLYHGGAPGFRPGDVILPHPTKHKDGCEWCASGADDNHRPDRVFASRDRLYGKFYASKFVDGWLYLVEPVGEMEPSDNDPSAFGAFQADAFRVVRVSERAVRLTHGERASLYRRWRRSDIADGRETAVISGLDLAMEKMLGRRVL